MLGVLLESSARVQRRGGGMALSVVAHVALIGAATAATVHSATAKPEKPTVDLIHFKRPPETKPVETPPPTTPVIAKFSSAPSLHVIDITPPQVVPPTLPPINPGGTPTPDDFVISRGGAGPSSGPPSLVGGPEESSTDWRGTEVLMHILAPAKPRYPESLRQAGVSGSVLVQFTVDTTGRVDAKSIKIMQSTHDLFSEAVRQSLGGMRFKPAEVNGKRVPALAQMPFEFQLNR
jgi:protein TonB